MSKGWTSEAQRDYGYCLTLIEPFFQDTRKAIVWMTVENPLLGDFSPQEMIRLGRTARLVKFIRLAEEEREQPTP